MANGAFMEADETGWRAAVRRFLPLVIVALLIGSLGALLYSASNAARDRVQRELAREREVPDATLGDAGAEAPATSIGAMTSGPVAAGAPGRVGSAAGGSDGGGSDGGGSAACRSSATASAFRVTGAAPTTGAGASRRSRSRAASATTS